MARHVETYEGLASAVIGLSEETDDMDTLDVGLYEKWGIDFETFAEIAATLIRFTPTMESPLTKRQMHLFGRPKGDAFIALARVPVD